MRSLRINQNTMGMNFLIDDITGEKKFRLTLVYHIGVLNNWKEVVADQSIRSYTPFVSGSIICYIFDNNKLVVISIMMRPWYEV